MKKLAFALLFGLLSFPALGHAELSNPIVNQEKSVTVHFSTTVLKSAGTTPVAFVLVHLSSPTFNTTYAFPHNETGELDVTEVRVDVDKVATSSGSVKIGVLTFVNQSTGSASFFFDRSFTNNVSNTSTVDEWNLAPAFWRLRIRPKAGATEGVTPFFATNDTDNGTTLYQTDVSMQSPLGLSAVFPGRGDIVMEILNKDFTNSITVSVDVVYHSEP